MNLKNKIFTVAAITALSITSVCVAFSNKNENLTLNPSTDIKVNFSEQGFTEDELVQQAELIVQGKITKLIKSDVQHIKKDPERGTGGAKLPYCIYNMEVTNTIFGESKKKEKIVFAGTSIPEDIELDKEYVFFLEEETNSEHKGEYHLLSYSQGVYKIEGDSLNGNTDKSIKYKMDDLKNRVKNKVKE